MQETRNASSQPNSNTYNHVNHTIKNVISHNFIQTIKKSGQECNLKVK